MLASNIVCSMEKPTGRPAYRKSLLKCGRRGRSRSLGPLINSDLCESISLALPPEERLEKLIRSAFELTMRSVGPQFFDEEEGMLSDFLFCGSKLFDGIDKQLKGENLYKLAIAESLHERCEDPNCLECKEIEEYSGTITRLQQESDEWNRIFSSERQKLQNAVSLARTSLEYKVTEDKYCYSDIWNRVCDLGIDIECLANEFKSTHDTLAYSLKLSDMSLEQFHSQMSGLLDTRAFATPKTLIKHVTNSQE